jgi:hypothetical protein
MVCWVSLLSRLPVETVSSRPRQLLLNLVGEAVTTAKSASYLRLGRHGDQSVRLHLVLLRRFTSESFFDAGQVHSDVSATPVVTEKVYGDEVATKFASFPPLEELGPSS